MDINKNVAILESVYRCVAKWDRLYNLNLNWNWNLHGYDFEYADLLI